MLQVVQKFLCFRKNKGKSLSVSAKVNPATITTTTYPCEICDLRFANKSLYLYHTKTHCSSGRPCGSIPPERSTQEKPNTPTTVAKPPTAQVKENSMVKRASNTSISRKRDSDVTNASFARSSQLDVSRRPSVIQIYFKSNTPHSRMSKVLYEEEKLNEIVEGLKTKIPRQRRDAELKFVTTNRQGKTHITYGIAEEWIEKYENFLNGKCRDPPGSINNQPLRERLKNRNIAQQTYAVNELVWRFLQKLYGGGPEVVYKEKSGSFVVSEDDRFSTTNDTFARSIKSEVLDVSLRGSIMDLDRTMKFDTDNPFRPMRMPNPGYYCYINTCLQVLLGIPEFVEYISQGKYKDLIKPEKARFWPAVAETVSAYSKGQTYFSPDSVKTIALDNFNPNEQHDAHEFMNFIMSGLQDEVNLPQPQKQIEHKNGLIAWDHYKKYNISILDELFAGQLASQIECSKCHNISKTYDPFLDLSLPVASESSVTLDNCLSAFLNGDETIDSYGCEKCKTNGKAVKRLRIGIFPKMLIVQLKRFQTYPKKEKIQNYVEFPTEKWEIFGEPESQREPQIYSLKAVICHIGPIDSGHYVCFSKRCNEWFLCDDERISRVAPKDISTGEAYVLIYKKEE